MSRAGKIAHQWLVTDEAMGAAEVPIARRVTAALRGRAMGANSPVAGAAGTTPKTRQLISQASAARPGPASPEVAPIRVPAEPKAATVANVGPGALGALPPAPAGLMAEEPQLTRAEKIQQMAVLAQEADKALAGHLSDVATRVVFGEGDPGARLMFFVGWPSGIQFWLLPG